MNQDIAKEWIGALTSGEFKQTTGVLHSEEGYCCLGVLCELYKRKTSTGEWVKNEPEQSTVRPKDGNAYSFIITESDQHDAVLPPSVMKWAGMADTKGRLRTEDPQNDECLARLNDKGQTFQQIAEIIKANVEDL